MTLRQGGGWYNGFSPSERSAAGNLIRRKIREGKWVPLISCDACGQAVGVIHAHLEDYSKPETYMPMCFVCHMLLHCRFRAPGAFYSYVTLLELGERVRPVSTWGVIQKHLAGAKVFKLEPRVGGRPGLLLDCAAGKYLPRRAG